MAGVQEEVEKAEGLKWVVQVKDDRTLVLKVPYSIKKEFVGRKAEVTKSHLLEIVAEISKWIPAPIDCYWLCPAVFYGDPHRLGQIINIEHAKAYITKLKEISELLGTPVPVPIP